MASSSITAYELMNAFYVYIVATKPSTSDIATYFAILSKWNISKRPESFITTTQELKALTGLKDATLFRSLKRLESQHIIHTQSKQGSLGIRISLNGEANWQYAEKQARPVKKASITRARTSKPEELENQERTRKPDETPIVEVIEQISKKTTSKYAGMNMQEMLAFRRAELAKKNNPE